MELTVLEKASAVSFSIVSLHSWAIVLPCDCSEAPYHIRLHSPPYSVWRISRHVLRCCFSQNHVVHVLLWLKKGNYIVHESCDDFSGAAASL